MACVNKTIVKPRVVAAVGRKTILNHASRQPNIYRWDFPDIIIFCVAADTISEKTIRFRHPDYNNNNNNNNNNISTEGLKK